MDYAGPKPASWWQRALDRIAPRTARGHDGLLIRWEPGDPWDPVHRWVVWTLTPIWRAPKLGIREALEGPNPRRFGHYDETLGRFVRTRSLPINRQQWEIHRGTGGYAQPLWIVQGRRGGHLRRFTDVQSTVSEMHGGSPEPPAPGALPYAPFDMRVVAKLKQLDLVDRFGDILGNFSRRPDLVDSLDRREREQVLEMAGQVWNFLGSQVEEAMNPCEGDGLTRRQADAIWQHADPNAPEPDYERIEEDFIDSVAHAYGG